MKRIWNIIKWLAVQIRTYLVTLILLIVMSAILSLCRVGMAIVSKYLIDAAVAGVWQKAVDYCLYFGAAILLQIGLKGGVSFLTVRTSESMSNKIRYKLFMHLTKVKWTEYSKYHTGDILTRTTSDVGIVVDGAASVMPEMIALGVGLLASFIALFVYDPVLAVFAFVLGPIAILMSYLFGTRLMKIHEEAQEAESKYRSYMQECLEHMLVLKTFCYEKESGERINQLQEDKKRLAIRKNIANAISGVFIAGGFGLSYLLAFGWGVLRLYKGSITFGTLTAFLQLIGQVQSPFLGLAGTLPQVIATAGSAKRLMELENLETEAQDKVEPDFDFTDITLEGVNFEYTRNNPVLKNVSAKIQAGETIGLIGMSGEGKTTLIYLLMQLLEPAEGKINLHYSKNNTAYSEKASYVFSRHMAEASIRTLIAYVPQGNTLFSGTITYNLKLGCTEATEEEQIAALQGADAWEFVEKLPEGIYTLIGERGLGLSEGQAQRIAIARALLRKTPILLLDEATSALDAETERKVLKAITELKPQRTCIVITHRPSMLEYCQRVWKISNGELLELPTAFNEVEAIEAI
ncbi:MAG: ABC transporter ATP-binding protein [Anaerocolumna sp.]